MVGELEPPEDFTWTQEPLLSCRWGSNPRPSPDASIDDMSVECHIMATFYSGIIKCFYGKEGHVVVAVVVLTVVVAEFVTGCFCL